MKLKINKLFAVLIITAASASFLLSSCYKKFDPKTYAPPLNIGGFTSAKEIAPANLVGYWAFNGSYVDSVSGAAGTNTGTSFSGGIKGQAMQGALNSYVLFNPGNTIKTMSSFTITYWVNSPAPSTGIIGLVNLAKTDGFWGNINMFFENGSTNTNGKFRANIHNGTSDTWLAKDDIQNLFGVWTNLALSYNAATSTLKLYKDGSPIASSTATGFGNLAFSNIGQIIFGTVQFMTTPSQTTATSSQPWASYLTGQLDEVRMYNKALSDVEVNSLVKLEGRGK
jgi:hypothetical protein